MLRSIVELLVLDAFPLVADPALVLLLTVAAPEDAL
jgi:hypothetical protein